MAWHSYGWLSLQKKWQEFGGWVSIHYHQTHFVTGYRFHSHSLEMNQTVIEKGVTILQTVGLCVLCLLIPLDQEIGTFQ